MRSGVQSQQSIPNTITLQDASYLGEYSAEENQQKQITVLYDIASGKENVVYASLDLNNDNVFNWVTIGNYTNGIDGFSIFAVNSSNIASVIGVAKIGDIFVITQALTYNEISYNEGDLITITSIEPFTADLKGNIKGPQGVQGLQGVPGVNGTNGYTPYIQNNNWYINGVDTGVKAVGVDGVNGQNGKAFAIQSNIYSTIANEGQEGNVTPDGVALETLPTLPATDISGKGFVVYDPLTTPLEPYYDLYWANNGDTTWSIIHPFSGIEGKDGKDGYTPYIQDNNWYINGVNTGVQVTGNQGQQGVGIEAIENDGTSRGSDYTINHIKILLTNGQEESVDILAEDGQQGQQGQTGTTGATPNITATATELPIGSQPTVTRSGSNENPLLNFGIPAGIKLVDYKLEYTQGDGASNAAFALFKINDTLGFMFCWGLTAAVRSNNVYFPYQFASATSYKITGNTNASGGSGVSDGMSTTNVTAAYGNVSHGASTKPAKNWQAMGFVTNFTRQY